MTYLGLTVEQFGATTVVFLVSFVVYLTCKNTKWTKIHKQTFEITVGLLISIKTHAQNKHHLTPEMFNLQRLEMQRDVHYASRIFQKCKNKKPSFWSTPSDAFKFVNLYPTYYTGRPVSRIEIF